MIDINRENNIELFIDYKVCLDYLKNIDYNLIEYPKETTNFHIYSEIKNEKELLCIESFLATQNLNKTKLIIWSDYDIKNNHLIQPYRNIVEFRIYDTKKEAIGTALENHPIWCGDISDSKYYMKSGILRFLVTHKYGGVWADMDMVFLRDFKPILDQEWAYMWGDKLDFENFGPCAAMMSFNKQSKLSSLCLEEICRTELVKDSTVLDHMLLAKDYKKCPFTIFPSTFFNIEWQLNSEYKNGVKFYDANGLGTKIEHGWFSKNEYSNMLFEECFAWHWHNSSHKTKPIEDGSKFSILTKKIKNLLKDKNIL